MVSNFSGGGTDYEQCIGGVEESNSSQQQQPWLMINDGKNCCIQNNMFNNKAPLLYDVGGEIPEFLGRHIAWSFGEWVLLTGTGTGHSLVNLLSKEIIELPSLDFNYGFCVLTSHPYDPTCHIVYFHEEKNAFIFCQPGEKEFTIRKWDYEFFPTLFVAVVAGKLFLAIREPSNIFSTAMIEFKESTYRLEVLQVQVDQEIRPSSYYADFFFFEYSGELFKVCKTVWLGFSSTVTGFQIIKADLVKKKWVSVKNLGRVAIFIGNNRTAQVQCASVESGITANSIYFLERDDPYNYYIYSLEEGTIRMKPTFFSSMEIETTKYTRLNWIMMHCEASFPKLVKGDQESICQDSDKENKASGEVVEVLGVQNSWNMVPPELLNSIQLHLLGRDHAVFRVVCKGWQQVSIRDYSIPSTPSLLSSTTLLELCQSSSPLLMFQEDITISDDNVPIFRFFDPVHRKWYRTGIPELRGTDIHYSRDGWLLVSRLSDRSIFFFNPLTQEKIELPTNPYYRHRSQYRHSFSFSSPPTCSNCLIVGMHRNGRLMFTLKHGEATWKGYRFDVQAEDTSYYDYCPVVLNGLHHFLSVNGDMVAFSLKDGVEGQSPHCQSWLTKFKRVGDLRQDDLRVEGFLLESDGALAFVCVELDRRGISIFKWNELETDWELLEEGGVDFGGKEMFLNRRGSFLETIDDVGGMQKNNIFLPMIDSDAKEGVFYSLATHRYHTFYSGYSSELPYNVDKFLNGIWVKPDRKIVGDNNLKWFM